MSALAHRHLRALRRASVILALLIGFVPLGYVLHHLSTVQASIQQSRLQACEDLDARHRATVKALDEVIGWALAREPARRAEILASQASTLLLINALAPLRSCARAVGPT